MKVYIRQNNNQFTNSMHCIAYLGFSKMGYEIEFFENIDECNNKVEDIIVGYVGDVHKALDKLNIKYPELNYPPSLQKYLHRNIWSSTLNYISSNPDKWPVFIKPKLTKTFTGLVITSTKDLVRCADVEKNIDIFCSDALDIVAEWRCFVLNGEIIDVRKYNGDYKTDNYDYHVIENILKDYINQPIAFCFDIGLTKEGETILIEINDGYSFGGYGLGCFDYSKMLEARWNELVNKKGEFYEKR